MTRMIISKGLYWGPFVLGNYHRVKGFRVRVQGF